MSFTDTRKFRNVRAGNHTVALVIDDLVSFDPFIARCIRIYGHAEQPLERDGMVGQGIYMRITRPSALPRGVGNSAVNTDSSRTPPPRTAPRAQTRGGGFPGGCRSLVRRGQDSQPVPSWSLSRPNGSGASTWIGPAT